MAQHTGLCKWFYSNMYSSHGSLSLGDVGVYDEISLCVVKSWTMYSSYMLKNMAEKKAKAQKVLFIRVLTE